MSTLNIAYESVNVEWNLPEWDYIVEEASKVFCLNSLEKNELYNSTTARIIATIPFAANCREAERTATAHIVLYLSEKRGFQKYCSHTPSDDFNIFNRLEPISHFKDGNLQIINHGMNMLALIMLEGYKHSCIKDEQSKTYNPILWKTWNYSKIKNKLLNELSKTQCALLDDLYYGSPMGPFW